MSASQPLGMDYADRIATQMYDAWMKSDTEETFEQLLARAVRKGYALGFGVIAA